jgi:hypothetical protein
MTFCNTRVGKELIHLSHWHWGKDDVIFPDEAEQLAIIFGQ